MSVDLGDKESVFELLKATQPKSIFHLAAYHGPSTKMTFEDEDIEAMKRIHVDATRNFLEVIETLGLDTHLVVAGSSRIFSPTEEITRVSEDSQPNPNDYYGESKLSAWELVKNSRKEFGNKASFLILFNHESPRRPQGYFSSDLASAIREYRFGTAQKVRVRDSNAWGDWSDARDVVELMASLIELPEGQDYVVSSGRLRSVRDILGNIFKLFGSIHIPELESKTNEVRKNRLYLEGDNQKSIAAGLWKPKHVIEETIAEMVQIGFEA